MDPIKIGNFIKQLRTERNMSQEDLAKFLFIDRSVISKWESGKRTPDIKYIAEMCKEFNVSLDEFVYGERNNQANQGEVKKNLLDYLVSQNTKYRKAKITSLFLGVAVVLIGLSFLIYYFSQTYDKTKVYRIFGNSENYTISEGLLFTTRDKTYLKLGKINSRYDDFDIDDIELIRISDNNEKVIYKGSSDKILVDFYGYNSKINAKNINELKDELYIKVNNENIKLSFNNNFENDNLVFNNDENPTNNENKNFNDNIPIRIKNEFRFEDDMYLLEIDNLTLKYLPDFETFYIENLSNNINVIYELISKNFTFDDRNGNNFIVTNENEVKCIGSNCHDELDLYNEYYTKYIEKYIKE